MRSQQTEFANFVGTKFKEGEQKQPHDIYNIFNNKPPPPTPPPGIAIKVAPNLEIQALPEKLKEEKDKSAEIA